MGYGHEDFSKLKASRKVRRSEPASLSRSGYTISTQMQKLDGSGKRKIFDPNAGLRQSPPQGSVYRTKVLRGSQGFPSAQNQQEDQPRLSTNPFEDPDNESYITFDDLGASQLTDLSNPQQRLSQRSDVIDIRNNFERAGAISPDRNPPAQRMERASVPTYISRFGNQAEGGKEDPERPSFNPFEDDNPNVSHKLTINTNFAPIQQGLLMGRNNNGILPGGKISQKKPSMNSYISPRYRGYGSEALRKERKQDQPKQPNVNPFVSQKVTERQYLGNLDFSTQDHQTYFKK